MEKSGLSLEKNVFLFADVIDFVILVKDKEEKYALSVPSKLEKILRIGISSFCLDLIA